MDAEAALAAALTYESLDDVARDAFLDAIDEDAATRSTFRRSRSTRRSWRSKMIRIVHQSATQLAIGRALRGKILDPRVCRDGRSRARVDGEQLTVLLLPLYLGFVEVLACRWNQENGCVSAEHEPLATRCANFSARKRGTASRSKKRRSTTPSKSLAHLARLVTLDVRAVFTTYCRRGRRKPRVRLMRSFRSPIFFPFGRRAVQPSMCQPQRHASAASGVEFRGAVTRGGRICFRLLDGFAGRFRTSSTNVAAAARVSFASSRPSIKTARSEARWSMLARRVARASLRDTTPARNTCKRGTFKDSLPHARHAHEIASPSKIRALELRNAEAPEPFIFTLPEEILEMDADEFRSILRDVIRDELGVSNVDIAGKWDGGEVIIKAGKEGVQDKHIPIESLFHKIVMIRDKLRVLEQKVNSHPKLSDEEKVQMQQYVTQCYGTLTTFNVLFADREDGFIGQKSE